MSTIATQMNWGSSYIVNDVYRRFIRTDASEKHYVLASRIATFVTVVLSIVVTYFMNRITGGWELVLALGAGTGLVYILRWYWWRINAWSEIAAMIAALVVSLGLTFSGAFDAGTAIGFAQTILTTVAVTTLVWVVVTFATKPEPMDTLVSFYRRVRPAGPGWSHVRVVAGLPAGGVDELGPSVVSWVMGIAIVYSVLFMLREILFGTGSRAAVFAAIGLVSGLVIARSLRSATSTR
jgi:Na+/pantothenate symporter